MRYSLVIMVLAAGISGVAFGCGPPSCPTCEYWNGNDCVSVICPDCQYCSYDDGRCHTWCPAGTSCCNGQSCCSPANCESCVNGWCQFCGGDPYKTCCNGQCCDPAQCQSCVNGQCQVCGGDTCYTCVNGQCVLCGGYPNKKCCDGTCYQECEESGDTTPCSSTKDTPCLGCVGLFGDCHTACHSYHYLNTTIYGCYGGCPGECDWVEPEPDCYKVYYCENYIHYVFAECTDMSETGPVPLDCWPQYVIPWSCTRCQEGELCSTETVPSRRCQ
jgi:hypothetical protein